MIKEEWRALKTPVCTYEGVYEVSNTGKVKSVGRLVKQHHNSRRLISERTLSEREAKGYLYVLIYENGKRKHYMIHRLVAWAFPEICGEWFEGSQINHKDENKKNNNAYNLEWCTPTYNINYGTGTQKRHKQSVYALNIDTNEVQLFNSIKDASESTNVPKSLISLCINGYRDSSKGFKFYKNG